MNSGNIAFLLQVVMAALSIKFIRQHHYALFRAGHALFPFVLIASVLHMGDMNLYFFQLGMILYAADLAQRLTVKLHKGRGVVTSAVSTDSEQVLA